MTSIAAGRWLWGGELEHRLIESRRQLFLLARRFWYATRRCWWHSYWQLDVEGLAHVPGSGPVLLCANHTSHLDAPAILAALPLRIALRTGTAAARDVFGDHALRNSVSRLVTNSMPLERGAEFAGGLRMLEHVLRGRRPLILFPEGRRSPDGKMVEFKCGAAMLAIRTGAPIVPIRLEGLHESLARGRHFPLPARVRVRFGAPIDPRPYRQAIDRGQLEKHEAYRRLVSDLKSAIAHLTDAP